jgi:alpha-glucosidase (family GH31 glycosyl hydrolase)
MYIKKAGMMIPFLLFVLCLQAQKKPFYKESFDGGKLPENWYIPKVGTWYPQWIVTNQPYPGSYKYQQQAPPIASKSRGYHLQFQAGYLKDEDVDGDWVKKHKYPDGYVISAPINCANKSSVILKFQHTFRWWDYHANDTAGLFVGVSTDSVHWREWDVRHEIKSGTDMLTPLKEEINITKWAANQPKVFLRFYWKGLEAWYWMVDDIELYEADKKDVGIVRLLSQAETGNKFTANDELRIRIRNNGSETITEPIKVTATVDGKEMAAQTIAAAAQPLKSEEERDVVFSHVDLSKSPVHKLVFNAQLQGDETPANNTLIQTVSTEASILGKLTKWTKLPNGVELQNGVTKVKVLFYRNDIFRIWLSSDGNYTNPAGTDIVIDETVHNPGLNITEDAKNVYVSSSKCKLQIQKNHILFSLYDANGKVIWSEKSPLTFGAKTIQKLNYHKDEYFYGGGMQNGYFSHKDSMILIEKGGGWNNGGRANPAPFYMSSYGYGALRNTFDAGVYDFTKYMLLSHNENRFDCFYFVGSSLKDILNDYTTVTGRPFMPARWQLSMGDANCYNKKGTTPDVIKLVADKYIENNMPRGWILPNDGYGCGYTKLDSTVKELHKRGFYTGLWTENGVDKIATEVGTYGTRLCKLDVAWVGPGYKYALDGCKAAYEGIEKNSDARGFVWSVMGWAGTQRYSVVWTGDQTSSWEYIRFHIPTVIGSGLSAQNCATGDIDAIFGGSAKTYVRDLQWKCFTPVLMTMSGWAKKDKQPWIWGEPYTSINRKYLQLKMRLTPYMYTLMHEANETGVPAVRGLLLEYPKDSITWGKSTQYEYLLGKSFLVAPVYKDTTKRDSIYLPEGKWVDYWNGTIYNGKQWLNSYDAPLEKLPLFVKAGAIIPMYPQMNFDKEKPLDTLFLDIYPHATTTYQLYEDDGLTREYKKGAYATTNISCSQKEGVVATTIEAIKGSYKGMLTKRSYTLYIHAAKKPTSVSVNGKTITTWSYDASDRNGIITINTIPTNVQEKVVVAVK